MLLAHEWESMEEGGPEMLAGTLPIEADRWGAALTEAGRGNARILWARRWRVAMLVFWSDGGVFTGSGVSRSTCCWTRSVWARSDSERDVGAVHSFDGGAVADLVQILFA